PPSPVFTAPIVKINKDYASGAFLVLRTEAANVDPPLWKIDGKSLLQKYCAFNQNGKTLYKNTAEYSGWSKTNQSNYFPVSVIFKQQVKKEHIVEVDRIKWLEQNHNTRCVKKVSDLDVWHELTLLSGNGNLESTPLHKPLPYSNASPTSGNTP
ncbi:hypothetical protein J6590_069141, partial [Homalodisca vitripennis]